MPSDLFTLNVLALGATAPIANKKPTAARYRKPSLIVCLVLGWNGFGPITYTGVLRTPNYRFGLNGSRADAFTIRYQWDNQTTI